MGTLLPGGFMRKNPSVHEITYRFRFDSGDEFSHEIRLREPELDLIGPEDSKLPEWTRLEHHQCPNCPLSREEFAHCPIAANMTQVMDKFGDRKSFEEVQVEVETYERTVTKRTSIQKGLSSLLGIYMVSSGCPVMDKLRPMVRLHLPFASIAETTYRTISMFMMAQYFRHRNGKKADVELDSLGDILKQIRIVDTAFCQRLSSAESEDAGVNAVVILTTFGDMVSYSVSKPDLERWERLFQPHLGD